MLMNRSILSALLLVSACVSLSAQWLDYRTPGIPRTPDGKPNLTAPAPKMPDGKPDLSGLWRVVRADARPGRPLYDLSTIVPGGIQMTPEAEKITAERAPFDSKARAIEPKPNCLPQGPVLDDYDIGSRLVQTPTLLLQLMDWNKAYRIVYLDGRSLPTVLEPTWDGYSVGHWDKDTLVVETIGLNGKPWMDIHGHPTSESTKVTERYHRDDFGHLTLQITVEDPTLYTKPWTATFNKVFVADTEMLDQICAEGEKDIKHIQKANEAGANK